MTSHIKSLTWRDFALALGAFAVTLAAFLPFARLGVDAHHDGIMVKTALDVLSGQTLFRDTFSQYGALTTYIQAFALWAFGPTLLVLKQCTVFAYALAAALMVLSWRSFLPLSLTVIAFIFWLCFPPFYETGWTLLPWSSVFALLFQCAAMVCLIYDLDFAAGIAVACAFWCRGTVGVFLAVAVIGIFWMQERSLKKFLVAFFVVHGVFLINILRSGAFADMWFQNYVWPGQWSEGKMGIIGVKRHLLPSSGQGLVLAAILIFFLAPFSDLRRRWKFLSLDRGLFRYLYGAAAVSFLVWTFQENPPLLNLMGGWASLIPAVTLVFFLTRWRSLPSAAWIACAVALSSWMQYIPVTDPRHIFWSASPMIGCVVYAGHAFVRQRKGAVIAVSVLILLPVLWERASVLNKNLSLPYFQLTHPPLLKGMKVTPDWDERVGPVVENVEKYFRTEASRPVLVEGRDTLYLAIGPDLKNPGPIFVYLREMRNPALVSQRVQFIRKYHPLIVIDEVPRGYLSPLLEKLNYTLYFQYKNGPKILAPPRSGPN